MSRIALINAWVQLAQYEVSHARMRTPDVGYLTVAITTAAMAEAIRARPNIAAFAK